MKIRDDWWLLVVLAALLVFGIILDRVVVYYVDANERQRLAEEVILASYILNPVDVMALTGTTKDYGTSEYQSSQRLLAKIRDAHKDFRFVYLMAQRKGEVVFLVDSEQPDSPQFSPPGEVYEDASQELLQALHSERSFIEGPITDDYGQWVSAHAPVIDTLSGKTIALVGIDVALDTWQGVVNDYRIFAFLITSLIGLVAVVGVVAHKVVSRDRAILAQSNRELQEKLDTIKRLEGILPICMYCKKIRDKSDYWQQLESYISENSSAEFSHGMCPACFEEHSHAFRQRKKG